MLSFKVLAVAVLVSLLSPSIGQAAEKSEQKSSDAAVKALMGDAKKSGRKKKVEICAECGKPETECDCEGEEHKKGASEKREKHSDDSH